MCGRFSRRLDGGYFAGAFLDFLHRRPGSRTPPR
jgi:hypothetical protein